MEILLNLGVCKSIMHNEWQKYFSKIPHNVHYVVWRQSETNPQGDRAIERTQPVD